MKFSLIPRSLTAAIAVALPLLFAASQASAAFNLRIPISPVCAHGGCAGGGGATPAPFGISLSPGAQGELVTLTGGVAPFVYGIVFEIVDGAPCNNPADPVSPYASLNSGGPNASACVHPEYGTFVAEVRVVSDAYDEGTQAWIPGPNEYLQVGFDRNWTNSLSYRIVVIDSKGDTASTGEISLAPLPLA